MSDLPRRSRQPPPESLGLSVALFLGLLLGGSCGQDLKGDSQSDPGSGTPTLEQRVTALTEELREVREESTQRFRILVLGLFFSFLVSLAGLFLGLRKGRGRPLPTGGPNERPAPGRGDRIGPKPRRSTEDMWSPSSEAGNDVESHAQTYSPPIAPGSFEPPADEPPIAPPVPSPVRDAAPVDPAASRSGHLPLTSGRRAATPERPPTAAESSALPHGDIPVALHELHRAGPELAQSFLGVDHRETTQKQLGPLLSERLERFREVARPGPGPQLDEWVNHDLVAILDGLAQLLSTAIEERRRGRGARQRVETELQRWLYERLAPICRDQGWFEVEPILPYATAFNPRIHNSIGSRQVDGAENLVIEIRSIGRRDPHSQEIVHLAEVVVGC